MQKQVQSLKEASDLQVVRRWGRSSAKGRLKFAATPLDTALVEVDRVDATQPHRLNVTVRAPLVYEDAIAGTWLRRARRQVLALAERGRGRGTHGAVHDGEQLLADGAQRRELEVRRRARHAGASGQADRRPSAHEQQWPTAHRRRHVERGVLHFNPAPHKPPQKEEGATRAEEHVEAGRAAGDHGQRVLVLHREEKNQSRYCEDVSGGPRPQQIDDQIQRPGGDVRIRRQEDGEEQEEQVERRGPEIQGDQRRYDSGLCERGPSTSKQLSGAPGSAVDRDSRPQGPHLQERLVVYGAKHQEEDERCRKEQSSLPLVNLHKDGCLRRQRAVAHGTSP
mmetsp:Transcript_44241/g.127903  ORF Transcript_44241/g.127903 Transcript_44241/m.127903 type:complete len:337 (+) Transcript_44241:472-1482(+)